MSEQTVEQPESIPDALSLICEETSISVEAAKPSDNGEAVLPTFRMVAYTGDAMRINGWRHPVVVDLQGLHIPSQRRPIRFAHSAFQGIGHSERIAAEGNQLIAEGVISRDTPAAKEVVTSGKRGFPWQASIGASVQNAELIRAGKFVNVNGRQFEGPVYVARKTTLGEISFVDLGADGATSATIAAQHKEHHTMSESQDTTTTTDRAKSSDAKPDNISVQASDESEDILNASRKQAADELRRQSAIRNTCGEKHAEIAAQAIEQGWSVEKAELEVLRASRPKATAPGSGQRNDSVNLPHVLAAAVCLAGGIQKPEEQFDEQTLDAADQRFRGQIGLQQLLLEAAWANGYDGRNFRADMRGVLQAAFSTFSLPGILSNTSNKFLLEGFTAVESAWRSIAATRNVQDFKQVTSYRLTGGFEYEEVGPDGELKHAKVGEENYTNQARTYGRMFSLTRTDLINDDLGALTSVPRRLGRGAALKLNDVFWTAFLNNAAFYTTPRGNYAAGASTALGIDSLTQAEQLYLDQTDPDGHPMAISPSILLVPNGLLVTATQLMNATEVREDGNSSKTKYPTNNPHTGKFRVVRSSYLANAKYTGSSTKAWYLLAEPADMPVIEVAFLNGKQEPVVESADADFNVLGIQMRGYHDFGVALQEYRGGVKFKGEA
ncbi:MAG: hypothetical protein ACE37H_00765 [Phycisphaeraceae bacterium]